MVREFNFNQNNYKLILLLFLDYFNTYHEFLLTKYWIQSGICYIIGFVISNILVSVWKSRGNFSTCFLILILVVRSKF